MQEQRVLKGQSDFGRVLQERKSGTFQRGLFLRAVAFQYKGAGRKQKGAAASHTRLYAGLCRCCVDRDDTVVVAYDDRSLIRPARWVHGVQYELVKMQGDPKRHE